MNKGLFFIFLFYQFCSLFLHFVFMSLRKKLLTPFFSLASSPPPVLSLYIFSPLSEYRGRRQDIQLTREGEETWEAGVSLFLSPFFSLALSLTLSLSLSVSSCKSPPSKLLYNAASIHPDSPVQLTNHLYQLQTIQDKLEISSCVYLVNL